MAHSGRRIMFEITLTTNMEPIGVAHTEDFAPCPLFSDTLKCTMGR